MPHATVTNEDYDFFMESVKAQGANPGYGNLLLAEPKNFTSIAAAPSSGTVEGMLRIITDDHTFPVGKGFRTLTLYRGDSSTEGSFPGDAGFKTNQYGAKGFLVGDDPATREFAEQIKNKGVILLQTSADCTDTRILQHGCACSPVVVKDVKYSSGTRISGGKKGYELTFECMDIFDYQGIVPFAHLLICTSAHFRICTFSKNISLPA